MSEQVVVYPFSAGAQFSNGVAKVDGVPKDDVRDDEIEARCSIALIFEGPVADFAKAMKKYSPSEGVARLTLVEACVCPPPQRWIADPVEGEEGAFEATYSRRVFASAQSGCPL